MDPAEIIVHLAMASFKDSHDLAHDLAFCNEFDRGENSYGPMLAMYNFKHLGFRNVDIKVGIHHPTLKVTLTSTHRTILTSYS